MLRHAGLFRLRSKSTANQAQLARFLLESGSGDILLENGYYLALEQTGGIGTISVTVSPTGAALTATGGTIAVTVSPTAATLTPSAGSISVTVSSTAATLTGS